MPSPQHCSHSQLHCPFTLQVDGRIYFLARESGAKQLFQRKNALVKTAAVTATTSAAKRFGNLCAAHAMLCDAKTNILRAQPGMSAPRQSASVELHMRHDGC